MQDALLTRTAFSPPLPCIAVSASHAALWSSVHIPCPFVRGGKASLISYPLNKYAGFSELSGEYFAPLAVPWWPLVLHAAWISLKKNSARWHNERLLQVFHLIPFLAGKKWTVLIWQQQWLLQGGKETVIIFSKCNYKMRCFFIRVHTS